MRSMLVLEFVAKLLRGLSGRKDEKPKPVVDPYDGILEGMNVRDKNSGEYGKCCARYSVGSDNGSVFMLKFSLISEGQEVERKVACANCEIMTDDMIKAAKKLAKETAERLEKESVLREKAAEKAAQTQQAKP